MSGVKKGVTATDHAPTVAMLDGMSKAALADLVVDLVRQNLGEEVEGMALHGAIEAAAAPRLKARGDARTLSAGNWAASLYKRFGARANMIIEQELTR